MWLPRAFHGFGHLEHVLHVFVRVNAVGRASKSSGQRLIQASVLPPKPRACFVVPGSYIEQG